MTAEHEWPIVRLGDFLTTANTPERISTPDVEAFITVKLHGEGAVRRSIGTGKTPRPFTGYRVSAGQFIYSRIDARNGAFAIVPQKLDGSVVSKDFPVFNIDISLCNPKFLEHFLKTRILAEMARSRSSGATNRQRIKEDILLDFQILLPPLDEQRRIARILDQIESLISKIDQTIELLNELLGSHFRQCFKSDSTRRNSVKLRSIASLVGGKSIVAKSSDVTSPFKVLKTSAITSGTFNASESKDLPSDYIPPEGHIVKPGDLLISRASGTAQLIGAVSLVPQGVSANLAIPDKIWRFKWKSAHSSPTFYYSCFQLPETKAQIRHASSGSGASFMKNIPKSKLLEIDLPDASFKEQESFANFSYQVEFTKQRLAQKKDFLRQILISIQSRAFQGKL